MAFSVHHSCSASGEAVWVTAVLPIICVAWWKMDCGAWQYDMRYFR